MVRAQGSQIFVCPPPWQVFWYAARLLRILTRDGPFDVIHTHLWFFNAIPLVLARGARVPSRIAHIYPLSDIKRQTVLRRIYRRVSVALIKRNATFLLSDSRSSLRAFERLMGRAPIPFAVLHCGIDLAPFAGVSDTDGVRSSLKLPSDKWVITYVARFAENKNHRMLFRIADRLNADGYRYHFALAGSHGDLLKEIVELASGRQDVSVIVGLPEVAPLLLASDLFLFPSVEEGFGLVALEAAAAGLPIVATDLPSIKEATPPTFHRWMFTPNDVERAAANVRDILNDDQLRSALAADGRRWVEGFSIQKSAEELLSVYEQCVRGVTPVDARKSMNAGS
jgi:glycosyltransferase involved in cell wall biosynthesis